MFTIEYVPSTAHLLFPPIIFSILVILLFIMAIQRFIKCLKERKPFFNFKNYSFFEKNFDKIRLFGCLGLLILYSIFLPLIGFLPTSIIFILAFNIVFVGVNKIKSIPLVFKNKEFFKNKDFCSLVHSLIISVVGSTVIWFIFSKVFYITLP